jgi:hypothetical protein
MLNQNLDASSAAGNAAARGPRSSALSAANVWRSAAARYHAHAANLNRARGRSPSNLLKQPFFVPERQV